MVDKLVAPLFIALWMALGWTLKLDPNQYLLLGTPLTVIFQLFVNRRPLRAMWVRNAPHAGRSSRHSGWCSQRAGAVDA